MIEHLPGKPIGVMIVDDNAVVRMGLRALINTEPRLSVVGEAGNGRTALHLAQQLHPDVILLDNRMPQVDGLSVLRPLAAISRVLMATYAHDPATVESAMRLGASGFLVHGDFAPDELIRAILRAGPGLAYLSPQATSAVLTRLHTSAPHRAALHTRQLDALTRREREIMNLVAQGLSNSRIASRLVLSEKTVKNHINHILGKLHATNRAEAMAHWLGTDRQDSSQAGTADPPTHAHRDGPRQPSSGTPWLTGAGWAHPQTPDPEAQGRGRSRS
ncbi:LuxR family two component transcriptional regulator [Streptomyces sp. TLI_235]|nr:response regulator transcription factor [Streptomyces sp. TLI_235]PBC69621.1 LuxR family two component transcriptional regulator [Streptomyces sp. TLI_235]